MAIQKLTRREAVEHSTGAPDKKLAMDKVKLEPYKMLAYIPFPEARARILMFIIFSRTFLILLRRLLVIAMTINI